MRYDPFQLLLRLPGASAHSWQLSGRLTRQEAALLVKLRADKWPWIGVRPVTFTLADGARYTPSIVTTDEDVIVCWEPSKPWLMPDASRLPVLTSPTVYFVVADPLAGEWLEHAIAPMSDMTADWLAARPLLARIRGRPVTDWDLRDWRDETARAMQRKCARFSKVHRGTPTKASTPDLILAGV